MRESQAWEDKWVEISKKMANVSIDISYHTIYGFYKGKFGGLKMLAVGLLIPAALIYLLSAFPRYSILVTHYLSPILPSARRYLEMIPDEVQKGIISATSFYSIIFVFGSVLQTRFWRYPKCILETYAIFTVKPKKAEERRGKRAIALLLIFSNLLLFWGITGWIWGIFSDCNSGNIFRIALTLQPCWGSHYDSLKFNLYGLITLSAFIGNLHLYISLSNLTGKK